MPAWAGEDIATLRAEAEKGDPKAQNRLGLLYAKGPGVLKDYKKATSWYPLPFEKMDLHSMRLSIKKRPEFLRAGFDL